MKTAVVSCVALLNVCTVLAADDLNGRDFSSVAGDLAVAAQGGEIPGFVSDAVRSGLASGNDLIWGGSGIWDDASLGWYTSAGTKTAWIDGANAVFPQNAQVSVAGNKNCGNIVIGDAGSKVGVSFTGDAISFADGATVTLNGKVLEFGGAVSSPGTLSFACNSVDESFCAFTNPLTFEETLLFPGAKVDDISNLAIRMKGKFGGSRPVATVTTEIDKEGNGIHFYSKSQTQITGQAKIKTFGSYGGVWEVVKFILTEKADGVYGRVEYVCGGTGNGGWTADVDMDAVEANKRPNTGATNLVTAPEDDPAWESAPTYSAAIYAISYNNKNIVFVQPEIRISGSLEVGSELTLGEDVVLKTIGTGVLGAEGVFKQAIGGQGSLVVDSTASQSFAGTRTFTGYVLVGENAKAVSFIDKNDGNCTDFRIAGVATVGGNGGGSAAGYWALPQKSGATKVLPGGQLVMKSFYYQYGPCEIAPIYVYTNATMKLTKDWGVGRSKPVHLIGGKLFEEGNLQQLVQKLYMADGATYTGHIAYMGDAASYAWSFIDVGGTVPSVFNATSLIIGWGKAATKNKYVGAKFIVADVTGDGRTDFTINSVISDKEDGSRFYEEGYRSHCGIWKTGAGTLELTAAGSCATNGVFKIDAGTVRLAEGSSGEYGAMILEGNAAIDCDGGSISFDASAEFEWADGAVLDITGTLDRRKIRFGVDRNGLSAKQLSSLAYNGRVGALQIDANGYLVANRGFSVFIK